MWRSSLRSWHVFARLNIAWFSFNVFHFHIEIVCLLMIILRFECLCIWEMSCEMGDTMDYFSLLIDKLLYFYNSSCYLFWRKYFLEFERKRKSLHLDSWIFHIHSYEVVQPSVRHHSFNTGMFISLVYFY